MSPGWTTARRFGTAISRIRAMRAKEITTPPNTGMAPPERPVPAPRGTRGTRFPAQKRASFATSAVSCGRTTPQRREPGAARARQAARGGRHGDRGDRRADRSDGGGDAAHAVVVLLV